MVSDDRCSSSAGNKADRARESRLRVVRRRQMLELQESSFLKMLSLGVCHVQP
jgi:hypothetical protein